ncbi:synaptonemal complex protein 2-like isoform X1 [Crotalus tigris]|uniref:synaptonemal complex protein 2-like isoform X1 n=2 Tax=Crotalus tigris TaxID=88082 RepID=UPI00192F18B4|nr:synaptonemal complex protein 2-like isoform X1 [Crotalus tigris]XP_039205510.1 synaptonemal complex protein 2-like isoform X1 [Crotalus tigris]
MADITEYYLESLLSDAFKGKGFQKISEMIQEKDKYVPQKCKKQLLNQLDKALKKELDKNEFSNVSLLLKCIQLYCRSDLQESINLLLQQGLIPKMVTWFERTREFLSLIEVKESNYLVNLVEDLCDTTLIIGKSSTEGRKQLLDSFIQHLGHLATESNVNCALRQEALRTLNTLLANVTREEKKAFAASEEMCLLMKELVKTIQEVGDYDIQVALVEALFRLMLKKQRDDLVHSWFEDQYVTKAFKEIKDRDFETDSRKFLNELNERLGDKRRIYSIPCKAAYADLIELKKPADNKLEEFWIDFNYGSESITFYLESLESTFWESVRLPKRDLSSYYLQEEQEEKILKIITRRSVVINKAEITKIRIHFDSCFDILAPLLKAIGKEKMIILNEDENANLGDYQEQTATVSIQLERKEDLTETNSLSDILTSRQSNESVTPETNKIIIPAATITDGEKETQHLENKDGSQASSDRPSVSPSRSANTLAAPPSSQKLKISRLQPKDKADEPDVEGEADIHVGEIHPLEDDTLQKKKRARGSSKQMVESMMDEYDFHFSSDPSTHEMVSEMKQKIFVQKTLHKSLEKRNVKPNKFERSLPSNYKTHLFSESNPETLSNGMSEKSWICNSQNKTLPKVANYTRKKTRVRSKLKVLPLSSPSSGTDYVAKKMKNSAVPRDMIQRRTKPVSEMHHYTSYSPIHVCSTPYSPIRQNGLEIMDATFPLSSSSSPNASDAKTSKKHEAAASTLLLEDKISNSKRKFSEWSADFNRKHSKHTEKQPSNESSIIFEPRKLFSSIEMADETPKGQPLNEFENEVFASKILREEIDDSGVIAAFENFTSELKKTFWFRYKRMEIYTRSLLKAPEQNISALLHRIHQKRLHELEIFHKSVVNELANLEKRTEFLSSLEKDTMDTVHGYTAGRHRGPGWNNSQ